MVRLIVIMSVLLSVGCRTTDSASLNWEFVEDLKRHRDEYRHVILICVYESCFEVLHADLPIGYSDRRGN